MKLRRDLKWPQILGLVALFVAVVLVSCWLAGCQQPYQEYGKIPTDFATVEEALWWVASYVERIPDPETGWGEMQLPHETFALGTGDCEDFVLLALYVVHWMGYDDAEMRTGWPPDHLYGHAWLWVDGHHWETFYAYIDDDLPLVFPRFQRSWTFDEAMATAARRAVVPAE